MRRLLSAAPLVGTLARLLGGLAASVAGAAAVAEVAYLLGTAVGLLAAMKGVAEALRARRLGADVVAVLALVGTVAVHELLAGAVVAVMVTTGQALESRASARARRDLTALLRRAPRVAHRVHGPSVDSVPVESVAVGDRLLVRPGETVPVDGSLVSPGAVLDTSALTGEPVPEDLSAGEPVRSGAVNAGGPFELQATTTAALSTYAGIVRLVEQAQAANAPFVRLADRYAGVFLPVTALVAAAAGAAAGSLARAVAVLVVATPCPLILAAPVAIVSGLSRAARLGVVVKDGGALERLGRAEVLLLDKTGTLTAGRPVVTEVVVSPDAGAVVADPAELLRLAACVELASPHVLAAAVVREARRRDLSVALAGDVEEVTGCGARGRVAGHLVAVGRGSWVAPGSHQRWLRQARRMAARKGALTVQVALDGTVAGLLLCEDLVRPDAARTLAALRRGGIRRVVMLTGDRAENAERIGLALGVDEVLAERSPLDKVDAVRMARGRGPTVMVGDGVNDAPALAAADVGVAVAGSTGTASSEAADVVLTGGRLDHLATVMHLARRSRRIARQSVLLGMGLSLVAMGFASVGALPATWGALLQELIDVAAIGNALRAATGGEPAHRLPPETVALVQRFAAEHAALRPGLDDLPVAAARLDEPGGLGRVAGVHRFLADAVVPHEQAEEALLYPAMAAALGGQDPTGTMSRAHGEICHQVRRVGRLLDELGGTPPDADDVADLRQLLYGLHALLALHFAQEEQGYFTLAGTAAPPAGGPSTPRLPVVDDVTRRTGAV